jgi:periplasmic divalent cation tolerance protein
MRSYYQWQGKPTRAKEWRLWIKFSSHQTRAIEQWLRENHPYSTPQWLAVEATTVSKPYREWILESTSRPTRRKKR